MDLTRPTGVMLSAASGSLESHCEPSVMANGVDKFRMG